MQEEGAACGVDDAGEEKGELIVMVACRARRVERMRGGSRAYGLDEWAARRRRRGRAHEEVLSRGWEGDSGPRGRL